MRRTKNSAARWSFFHCITVVLTIGSLAALPGCAVVAVVDTVGTVAIKTTGLAADTAISVVKITGRAVGIAADLVLTSGD